MSRKSHLVQSLFEKMLRPQRIGLFGYQGVGKTTLLTALYREAVAGRLPGLRLAAADARTSEFLADKILLFEAGRPLPVTQAEAELRFHLYSGATRLELVFRDYQGDHADLGRQEPIRAFLSDCDAVWLCLDLTAAVAPGERLRRQQEVEQLIEDYLAIEPERTTLHRPMALVLTKADLLNSPIDVGQLVRDELGMTHHALQTHCPQNGLFAVSSLSPFGLAEPLVWLATVLQAQDEARLDWFWRTAADDIALLERAVATFAHRYPDALATQVYRQRLSKLHQRRLRRRGMAGVGGIACLLAGLWTYDLLGYERAARFEIENTDEPAAVLERWHEFQAWHPSRHLSAVVSADAEKVRMRSLEGQIRQQQSEQQLIELRRQARDEDADPEAVWRLFQDFRAAFPEIDVTGELAQLRSAIKGRYEDQVGYRAERAYDELIASERLNADLVATLTLANRFLRDFPGALQEKEVRRRRETYLLRIDERDFEEARLFSARSPFSFPARREQYQRYLNQHPAGSHAKLAREALQAIERDWDRHDFRAVRDHFLDRPADVPRLVTLCRTYLAVHPSGQFTASATDLLRWSERVTAPSDYRVVLRSGSFEKRIAHFFSRGPDLSVELEVGGIRYGPSTIVANRYDPTWDYEFPRRIRWKLGDPVIIRVVDHDWKDRVVIEIASEAGDPLALRMLCGEVFSGWNRIDFAADFALPRLPKIE